MSKLSNVLKSIKAAAPHVKTILTIAAAANDGKTYKHKDKVDKALNGAYKATEVIERVL